MESRLVKMIADRPFMFALRDKASGLIIVAGFVADPGASATAAEPPEPPRRRRLDGLRQWPRPPHSVIPEKIQPGSVHPAKI